MQGAAYALSLQPGRDGKDLENWLEAEQSVLNNKLLKTLTNRA